MTTYESNIRAGENADGRRKRRRKALSCLECRRRKVKCDRRYPCCNRCQEHGSTVVCTYTSDVPRPHNNNGEETSDDSDHAVLSNHGSLNTPVTTASHDAVEDVTFTVRMQARKISYLEGRLARLESKSSPVLNDQNPIWPMRWNKRDRRESRSPEPWEQQLPLDKEELCIFRGKGFKTQFHGASCPINLLVAFPEVHSFMGEAYDLNTAASRARRDLRVFTQRRKSMAPVTLLDDAELLSLVPTRDVADKYIDLALGTFETTLHVLHVPSFLTEYNEFWEAPERARPGFLALLLVVMATVSCLFPQETTGYIGDSSRGREFGIRRIEVVDLWVDRQSQKHLNLTIFQVRCLSLLAKQVTGMKMKGYWACAGMLLRTGMAAGLHRNNNLLGKKPTPFDQEMRSRVFATMMELELQASIDRGLLSMSTSLPFDCAAPCNLDDSDFSPSSESLPPSRPIKEFTRGSYLHLSRNSLSLRIAINTLVNDNTSSVQFDDILPLHDKIISHLESLPDWQDQVSNRVIRGQPSPALAHILLDMQLRQYLLLLHGPFAQRKDSNSRYDYSRMTCLNAASSIINQHAKLTASGNFAACLLRQDVYRAGLVITHNVFNSSLNPVTDSFYPSPTATANASYNPLLERVISIMSERLLRLGRGYKEHCVVSGAHHLVLSKLSPETAEAQKFESIERIARLYYKVLACQESPLGIIGGPGGGSSDVIGSNATEIGTVKSNGDISMGSSDLPAASAASGTQQTLIPEDINFGEFGYEDLSSWTFNSFWPFDPNSV